MREIDKKIMELTDVVAHPAETVKAYLNETGKKAIGCFPVYSPEEIVYAAGMLPVGMWGGQTEIQNAPRYLQSFCCSVMKAVVENGMNGVYDILSGAITTTFCDTLKCIGEVWKAAVPQVQHLAIVYPQNRQTDAGINFLERELRRIAEELVELGGTKITETSLNESIKIYNEYRQTARAFTEIAPSYQKTITPAVRHQIIKAAYFMDKKIYTEKLKDVIDTLKTCEPETGKTGVILTGLLAEPTEFLDIFDEHNFYIAADDLVQESKQFRADVPDGNEDPFHRIASRITEMDGCALLYDAGKKRGENLIRMIHETGAKGVVICMMKFCDPEEFDYPIYKKELEAAGIPMLYLEVEQRMDSAEQLRTRIQTFKELLEMRD